MATQEHKEQTSDNTNIREDLVDTAVKFLRNPKVVHSPLGQKQTFLQRRGLTEEEIRVACERSGAYEQHEKPSHPPPLSSNMLMSYGGGHISLFSRIRDVVHSIAVFSVVAYVIKKFYERYIAPFLFGTRKKSVEDKLEDLENNINSFKSDIQTSVSEVKSEVDKIGFSSENELISELKELRSEVATVKGLLLTRKQFPAVSHSSIPSWQMANNEEESEENKEDLMEIGSGSGSSEPEHGMKTSESSLEIINHEDLN
ncbi:peroxisomal membrane protein PEX14 isoform X2 [Anthonomus grandis grandis]|uniref:peroxisomal membrane protein PEX14 isoform X2 n=1 Tax=Anthonomus grandis grandis TaxID=2921223 RepID=UPI002165472E|nr:peroxisomal membrane protein PEX14 isoform X2 [Anthonomus grandis grandis]